jgi:C4-dicarboxylate-specific signal transduction histidine kinase
LLVVLFQAAIIFWLLFERHRRQASETESRARLRQLIHLDRVAGVGAISASFAHELNQPLGAIMANAEAAEILMGTSPVDHSQIMEILGDIRRSNRHAGDMIAHLRLLLKRRDAIELQEFDLNDALRDALLTVNSEARKKGVMVSVYQIPGALPVRADQIHLEQVVINLASNAMDAMQDSAPAARIMTVQTALLNDSEVEVSVSDSGTGIPEDKLEAIFEPFVTTKQQGNGLGLSIARTIMENYGGKIHAENRPAGGAVFRFTLPLTKARPA